MADISLFKKNMLSQPTCHNVHRYVIIPRPSLSYVHCLARQIPLLRSDQSTHTVHSVQHGKLSATGWWFFKCCTHPTFPIWNRACYKQL